MALSYEKVPLYRYFCLDYQEILCHLMQSKLLSIGAELRKDSFKGLEMSELNDTENFTSQILYVYAHNSSH